MDYLKRVLNCKKDPFYPYSVEEAFILEVTPRMSGPKRANVERWLFEKFELTKDKADACIDSMLSRGLILDICDELHLNRNSEKAVNASDKFRGNNYREIFHEHDKCYIQHGMFPFKFKTHAGDTCGHNYYRCLLNDSELWPELVGKEIERIHVGCSSNKLALMRMGTTTIESLPWRDYEPPYETPDWKWYKTIEMDTSMCRYIIK